MPFPRRHAPIVLVLAAAAALRLYHLGSLPPANYRDVAMTANDALRAASGHPRLHFTYDEGLYADLMGLGFALFGASDLTLRLPGVLFGILTCWGVLRLGRALGRERAGLYGAALLAVSFWHVLLSRSGFRAVLLPCLLAFSAALLVEGLRDAEAGRKRTARLAAAGALLGLGVHVYPAVRFAPLFVLAYVLAEALAARARARRILRGAAVTAAAAVAVAAPMLLHYAHHPEHFNFPRRVVSIFSRGVESAAIPGILSDNLRATILMFHAHGDDNNRHNLAGAPMLDPLTGVLFLLGLAVLLRRGPGADRALLLGWMGAMLLPNLLSVQGVPHALRSCGVIPAVALLAGIGLEWARDRIRGRGAGDTGARVLVTGVVLVVAALTAWRYFGVWGRERQVAIDHDSAYRDAARLLLDAPSGDLVFLVANGEGLPAYGWPAETQAYLFEMRRRPPVLLGSKDASRLVLGGRRAWVALIRRDPHIVDLIRRLNPEAQVVEVRQGGAPSDSPVYRIN